MVILLGILKYILKFIYFFLKLLPTNKKKILFLSRQSDEPSIDFIYMISDFNKRYPDFKIVTLCKRMEKNNIKQIISYLFHPLVQIYHLATSTICIVDGYQIPVSCLKHKKTLTIIQIWHSLGAIKKFGYQTLNTPKEQKIAKVMCMHKNYDLIVSGSKSMTKYFAKAFNYPENKFIECGLPRIDYLLNTEKTNKERVYKKYPELKHKKIVLYAPTFRTYNEYQVKELINAFGKSSKWQLIIKKHPRMKIQIPKEYSYSKVTSLELLSVANVVVTDYSAIAIEAAILNKPVMLFTYDYNKYAKAEGINTDIRKDLPGYVFDNPEDLVKCIKNNNYDMEVLQKYKSRYVSNCDGTTTQKLVDAIMEVRNEKN